MTVTPLEAVDNYDDTLVKKAKLRALNLLNTMGRTEAQLRQKLKQSNYPEEVIEIAMDYVKSFGYVNDFEYARSFIQNRKEKKSQKELYMLLSQKGIKNDILDMVFEEYYDSDSSKEAIITILRKKKYNSDTATREETQKMYAFLTRKGFAYDDIRRVLTCYDFS